MARKKTTEENGATPVTTRRKADPISRELKLILMNTKNFVSRYQGAKREDVNTGASVISADELENLKATALFIERSLNGVKNALASIDAED